METRKIAHRKISGRLLKVLTADEREREIEDSVRTDFEAEPPTEPFVELEEDEAEEAATETGFTRPRGRPSG